MNLLDMPVSRLDDTLARVAGKAAADNLREVHRRNRQSTVCKATLAKRRATLGDSLLYEQIVRPNGTRRCWTLMLIVADAKSPHLSLIIEQQHNMMQDLYEIAVITGHVLQRIVQRETKTARDAVKIVKALLKPLCPKLFELVHTGSPLEKEVRLSVTHTSGALLGYMPLGKPMVFKTYVSIYDITDKTLSAQCLASSTPTLRIEGTPV